MTPTEKFLKEVKARAAGRDFGKWWFVAGGSIHGAFKHRRWSELKRLAEALPRIAWDWHSGMASDVPRLVAMVEIALQDLKGTASCESCCTCSAGATRALQEFDRIAAGEGVKG